jgi:hypothetical protein
MEPYESKCQSSLKGLGEMATDASKNELLQLFVEKKALDPFKWAH